MRPRISTQAAPLADVIRKCFTTAQADRPTAEQLVSLLLQAVAAAAGADAAGGEAGDGLSLKAELRGVKVLPSAREPSCTTLFSGGFAWGLYGSAR